MSDALRELLQKVKSNRKVRDYDEAKAKAGIIIPLLKTLGWDPFDVDEIIPEYPVGTGKIDYALKIEGKNKVFIEAKKPDSELNDHQKQILDYAFQKGVELAILTNGLSWWFYSSLEKCDWKDRKFCVIEIHEQILDEVTVKFENLLSKESVSKERWRDVVKKESIRVEPEKMRNILSAAWNDIISEPHRSLLSLLSETTKEKCRQGPSDDEIRNFFKSNRNKFLVDTEEEQQVSIWPKNPYEQQLFTKHILERKSLWEQFIQKKELTSDDFKDLSNFGPVAIGGFTKFLAKYHLAKRTGNTFIINKDIVQKIKDLLDTPPEQEFQPLDFDTIPEELIQKNILDRDKLWKVFLKQKKMTGLEFKKYSEFKVKGITGFQIFLIARGIARQTGNTFELNPSAVEIIQKYLG